MNLEADPIDVVDEIVDVDADPIVDAPELEAGPLAKADDKVVDKIVDKPKTMEETIRDKLREMNKPVEEKPAVVKPIQAKDPVTGKFIETPEQKAAAEKAAALKAPIEKIVPPIDQRLEKAPSSWRGPVQAKWSALDPEVRAEVLKREDDFHKGVQQYKQKSDNFDILDGVIRPYAPMIHAAGTNAQSVIQDFFNTAYLLKTGTPESKVQTWLNIGKEYGVDTSLLPDVQAKIDAGQPIISPELLQLREELGQVRGTLQQQQEAQRQAQAQAEQEARAEIDAEVASFGQGKEHFEVARPMMAALMESGQAKDFQDAYDKACWALPEVRVKLEAQQREVTRKQAAEKAAAAKKAASTNVVTRGTPPASKTPVVGTMEETIRANLRAIQSRTG